MPKRLTEQEIAEQAQRDRERDLAVKQEQLAQLPAEDHERRKRLMVSIERIQRRIQNPSPRIRIPIGHAGTMFG